MSEQASGACHTFRGTPCEKCGKRHQRNSRFFRWEQMRARPDPPAQLFPTRHRSAQPPPRSKATREQIAEIRRTLIALDAEGKAALCWLCDRWCADIDQLAKHRTKDHGVKPAPDLFRALAIEAPKAGGAT